MSNLDMLRNTVFNGYMYPPEGMRPIDADGEYMNLPIPIKARVTELKPITMEGSGNYRFVLEGEDDIGRFKLIGAIQEPGVLENWNRRTNVAFNRVYPDGVPDDVEPDWFFEGEMYLTDSRVTMEGNAGGRYWRMDSGPIIPHTVPGVG